MNVIEGEEFADIITIPYYELTPKDHVWIEISFDLADDYVADIAPCFVIHMNQKEGAYGYYAPEIKGASKNQYSFTYLTPEIRSTNDELKSYFWNRDKKLLKIKDLKVNIWERKINY